MGPQPHEPPPRLATVVIPMPASWDDEPAAPAQHGGGDGPSDLLAELDASLHQANGGLQELMSLLAGCAPAAPLKAHGVMALLRPIADLVDQAAHTAELLTDPDG